MKKLVNSSQSHRHCHISFVIRITEKRIRPWSSSPTYINIAGYITTYLGLLSRTKASNFYIKMPAPTYINIAGYITYYLGLLSPTKSSNSEIKMAAPKVLYTNRISTFFLKFSFVT